MRPREVFLGPPQKSKHHTSNVRGRAGVRERVRRCAGARACIGPVCSDLGHVGR